MREWNKTVDLLVFGSGAAGMTSALVASQEGLEVLVCEKTAKVGGTTATSAGTLWIPGNNQGGRAGAPDSKEDARRYLKSELGSHARADLFEAFLESGPAAIDYLEAHTDLQFDILRNPDYHRDEPGAVEIGRALAPKLFDGRQLGKDFSLLREPRSTLMIFGGMMIGRREVLTLLRPFASLASFRHVVSILLRQFRDRLRYQRGTRLMLGNALVARFLVSLRKKGIPLWTNARLVELMREQGRVSGAIVEVNGERCSIQARRGVVLATGGFPGSMEWRKKYMADLPLVYSYAFENSEGDALNCAVAIGAAIDDAHASPAFWTPVSVLKRPDGSQTVWAHHSLDRASPGVIAVNSKGQRFVNEGDAYHDFVVGMVQSQKNAPSIPAYLVCDRRFVRKYGLGLVRPKYQWLKPYIQAGYLISADTIPELAGRIGIDPAGLKATVAENNRSTLSGVDEKFGKGSKWLNRYYGDPDHGRGPNPCLGPIEHPPFFAVAVYPGIIATSIGIRTDAHARVIDDDGTPIVGLYACGSDMGSVMRGCYPGPGCNLGPAVTFAYRAAMHVAHN